MLHLTESLDGGLEGGFGYSSDLFNHSTMQRMARHFETLVASVVADVDGPAQSLSMMD